MRTWRRAALPLLFFRLFSPPRRRATSTPGSSITRSLWRALRGAADEADHALADVKAKHRGEPGWREPSSTTKIRAPSSSRSRPGPRTRADCILTPQPGGRGSKAASASKSKSRTAPSRCSKRPKALRLRVRARCCHSFAVVGSLPAISFEVTLASATPVYPDRPADAPPGTNSFRSVEHRSQPARRTRPERKPWPIHFNVYDLATQNDAKTNWTQEAIRKNRARGNLICGQADPIDPRAEQPRALPLGLRRSGW